MLCACVVRTIYRQVYSMFMDWFWEEEALCYYYTLGPCVGPGPSMRPAGGGMVEKSGEYLLQRFYMQIIKVLQDSYPRNAVKIDMDVKWS